VIPPPLESSANASRPTTPADRRTGSSREVCEQFHRLLAPRPHPQVKIPARGGKLPGTYQGRRGPRPLRGAINGPGAMACCPSSSVRGGRRP
jgi:hypothetical protein